MTDFLRCQISTFSINVFFAYLFFKFRYHSRVLYIDIDIHHGDGVQVTN